MIIEDVEDHALLIVRELQKGGFDPSYQVIDNVQALKAALDPGLDAIISDFSLPGFNALDALRMVQAKGLDVPVIIVSGVMGEETAVEAMKAGAHDFILKGRYSRLVPALERELQEAVVRRERKLAGEELLQAHKELKKQQAELERQHRELLQTYHRLEEETSQHLLAVEELRQKDQMMIQQSRMAAMGEMLSNVAHQWRQPLNVLGLKVQEIGLCFEYGGFSKELLDANIAKALEIVQHLSQTIDDFRNMSAPDKEKSRFKVEQVVAKTLSLVEGSFSEKGIGIELSTSGDPEINGYANEYCQVLLNILMNAKDMFLQRGTVDPHIAVRSWTDGGKAVLVITDNAGGIAEEILGKIFDAYFTTKELGKGTGVGLFMAKNIIEKNMGGRLTVRNIEGGAEFRIVV